MFTIRFDLRNPDWTARETADLWQAALDMAVYAEEHGAFMAVVSEHHGSPDGHVASPLVLASAIAARTTRLPVVVAALLVPLHDPIRLAEDMIVVDLVRPRTGQLRRRARLPPRGVRHVRPGPQAPGTTDGAVPRSVEGSVQHRGVRLRRSPRSDVPPPLHARRAGDHVPGAAASPRPSGPRSSTWASSRSPPTLR